MPAVFLIVMVPCRFKFDRRLRFRRSRDPGLSLYPFLIELDPGGIPFEGQHEMREKVTGKRLHAFEPYAPGGP